MNTAPKKFIMTARGTVNGGKDTHGYFILGIYDYTIKYLSVEHTKALAAQGEIINLAVNNGEIVSTNGSIKRYTNNAIDERKVIGKPRYVIISRIEENDKLIGYMVSNDKGCIVKITVEDAVKLANNDEIANGKLRQTATGMIVSSIGGEYPRFKQAPKQINEERDINIVMFREFIGKKAVPVVTVYIKYNNAMVLSRDFKELNSDKVRKQLEEAGCTDIGDEWLSKYCTNNGMIAEISYSDFISLCGRKGSKLNSKAAVGEGIIVACRDNESESGVNMTGDKMEVLGEGSKATQDAIKKYIVQIKKDMKVYSND